MIIKNKVYPKGVWFLDKEETNSEIVGSILGLMFVLYVVFQSWIILKLIVF